MSKIHPDESGEVPQEVMSREDKIYFSRCRKFVASPKQDVVLNGWKHVHARETHPNLPQRMPVGDEMVDWSVIFPKYEEQVPFADDPFLTETETTRTFLDTKPADNDENHDRCFMQIPVGKSGRGKWIEKNPCGRTGLSGRGLLKKWGPNRALDPVITRTESGGDKRTQVLVCTQLGKHEWSGRLSLPGGRIKDKGENAEVPEVKKAKVPENRKLGEYLLHVINKNAERFKRNQSHLVKVIDGHQTNLANFLSALFSEGGKKVFPNEHHRIGYCDDTRNTDDAWLETEVYHFHIPSGLCQSLKSIDLLEINEGNKFWPTQEGSADRCCFQWLTVSRSSQAFRELYASHKFFVELSLPVCRCGRREHDLSDGSHRCLRYSPGPKEYAREHLRLRAVPKSTGFDIVSAQSKYEEDAIIRWVPKKSRMQIWPGYRQQTAERYHVPDELVLWDSPFPEYEAKVTPQSIYNVGFSTARDHLDKGIVAAARQLAPYNHKNPYGRTGLRGKGTLFLWGPNYARDPVITRVERVSRRTQVLLCRFEGHEFEEVNKILRLPGGMCVHDLDRLPEQRKILQFLTAVLRSNCQLSGQSDSAVDELVDFFSQYRKPVYPDGKLYTVGYCDDMRNTDDAWIETNVYHFHLPAKLGDLLSLKKGVNNKWVPDPKSPLKLAFEWVDVEQIVDGSLEDCYASHAFFVDLCVPLCQCGLRKYDTVGDCHEDADEGFTSCLDAFTQGKWMLPKCGSALDAIRSGVLETVQYQERFHSCIDALHRLRNQLPSCLCALDALEIASADCELERFPADFPRGHIQFGGQSQFSTFVRARVDSYEDAVAVCRCLFGGNKPEMGSWWRDDRLGFWRPRAIISVTGGAQEFRLSHSWQDEVLMSGILRASKAMKALIIDGGFGVGVMRKVGEVVQKADGNQVAALGIVSWGAILERRRLLHFDRPGGEASEERVSKYFTSGDQQTCEWGARLDPNHQFFALIDGGHHGGKEAFGKEIESRYWIERVFSSEPTSTNCKGNEQNGHQTVENKFIPHVLLVVNGGPNTVKTIYQQHAFIKERKDTSGLIPVLAIQGSGKAADMIAMTWRHFHDVNNRKDCLCSGSNRKQCVSLVAPYTRDHVASQKVQCKFLQRQYRSIMLGNKKDDELTSFDMTILQLIVVICREKEFVSIYDFKDRVSLDYAILKCGCRSTNQKESNTAYQDQLHTIMDWDDTEAIKLAKTEILEPLLSEEPNATDKLEKVLEAALTKNRFEFVEMLHDCGVSMRQPPPLCETNLRRRQNVSSTIGRKVAGDVDIDIHLHLISDGLRRFLFPAVGRSPNANAKKGNINELEILAKRLMGWQRFSFMINSEKAGHDNQEEKLELTRFSCAEDLFLWSILTGRKEVADLYWRKCHPMSRQHCITRALFACAIVRTFANNSHLHPDAKIFLAGDSETSFAKHFETIATEILDICFRSSPEHAVTALTVPLLQPWLDWRCTWVNTDSFTHYKFLTPVKLAHIARATTFVSHTAFQACLDRMWYGRLVKDFPSNQESFRGTLLRLPRISQPTSFGLAVQLLVESAFILLSAVCPLLLYSLAFETDDGVRWPRGAKWMHRIVAFYTAPITKFTFAFSSYLCFLVIFTYVGLFMDYEYTLLEGIVHAFIFSVIMAEVRQLLSQGWKMYSSIGSNRVEVIMVLVYVPAFVLRLRELLLYDAASYAALGGRDANGTILALADGEGAHYAGLGEDLSAARSWHGLAGIVFWLRIFDYLRVSYSLGPFWLVLVRVGTDVMHFFIFLLVFIVAFGAAILCAARPRHDPSVSGFAAYLEIAIYLPYMEMFGEHYLDSIYFDSYPTGPAEGDNRRLGTVLLAVYLFISAVVLTNLLIAKMNATYTEVYTRSVQQWRFQRLELALEYAVRPVLPPPFGFIQDICMVLLPCIIRHRLSPKDLVEELDGHAERKSYSPAPAATAVGSGVHYGGSGCGSSGVASPSESGGLAADVQRTRRLSAQWLAEMHFEKESRWFGYYPPEAGARDRAKRISQRSEDLRRCAAAVGAAFGTWMAARQRRGAQGSVQPAPFVSTSAADLSQPSPFAMVGGSSAEATKDNFEEAILRRGASVLPAGGRVAGSNAPPRGQASGVPATAHSRADGFLTPERNRNDGSFRRERSSRFLPGDNSDSIHADAGQGRQLARGPSLGATRGHGNRELQPVSSAGWEPHTPGHLGSHERRDLHAAAEAARVAAAHTLEGPTPSSGGALPALPRGASRLLRPLPHSDTLGSLQALPSSGSTAGPRDAAAL